MRYIIVDGYNVIRADSRLQSLERTSLEHAREVLVQTLASSPRLANDRVVVVFDGTHGTRQHVHGHNRGRVVITYSARGQSADDVIVSQAGEYSRLGRVVVVSNDGEIRDQCVRMGCEVSGSENLLQQMPGRLSQPRPDEDNELATLSTAKRGNPRRAAKRTRRQREVRF